MGPRDAEGALRNRIARVHSDPARKGTGSWSRARLVIHKLLRSLVPSDDSQPGSETSLQLSQAFLCKLVTIKLMHSVQFFVCLAGLLAATDNHQLPPDASCGSTLTAVSPATRLLLAVVSGSGGMALLIQVLVVLLLGSFYQRHLRRINMAGLLVCGACRVAIITLGGGTRQTVFHNLLVVSFSLAAHEVGQ